MCVTDCHCLTVFALLGVWTSLCVCLSVPVCCHYLMADCVCAKSFRLHLHVSDQ